MANRRELKRNINGLLGDVIEECYESLLNNEGKNEKEVEAIVDEAVDLADELIARTNSAKSLKSKKEVQKHFSAIKEELGDKVIGFVEKLNAL
ncbi:MAG: hypothetical protein K0S44_1541 [Bacteroidetes bacterium]|jgi:hypothetical protein|nr:hypothetical protein [Bacteroidota bacterium]